MREAHRERRCAPMPKPDGRQNFPTCVTLFRFVTFCIASGFGSLSVRPMTTASPALLRFRFAGEKGERRPIVRRRLIWKLPAIEEQPLSADERCAIRSGGCESECRCRRSLLSMTFSPTFQLIAITADRRTAAIIYQAVYARSSPRVLRN